MAAVSERLDARRRARIDRQARQAIAGVPALEQRLVDYIAASDSRSCSWSDLWTLYSAVRRHRPAEVLECGTGVSTMSIGQALLDNGAGRVTSMDSVKQWYDHAVDLLPDDLTDVVDLRVSDRAEYSHSIFRGIGYADVPERRYEFVFVDGPNTKAFDGTRSFDIDLLNVIKRADWPVHGLIDNRQTTAYVMQKILGADKVRPDRLRNMTEVGPCDASDVKSDCGRGALRERHGSIELVRLIDHIDKPVYRPN